MDIGQREIRDVVGDAIHLFGRHLEFGPDARQQGTGKDVDEDLSDYADGAEARLVVVGGQAGHSTDESQQALKDRPADFIDKVPKRGCGLCEFVGQDTKMPIRPVSFADALQANSDHCAQDVFGRRKQVERALDGLDFGSAYGLLHGLGIQPQFVAEVIVHGGDVCPGGDAYLANGGGAVAPVGKDSAGDVE